MSRGVGLGLGSRRLGHLATVDDDDDDDAIDKLSQQQHNNKKRERALLCTL